MFAPIMDSWMSLLHRFAPDAHDANICHSVRQETERLQQDALNRSKYAKNLTHAASPFTAGEEIP